KTYSSPKDMMGFICFMYELFLNQRIRIPVEKKGWYLIR
ncbi:MAG: hypothetical protein ACI9AV_002445, partial [Sediminicola sp.]